MNDIELHKRVMELKGKKYKGREIYSVEHDEETGIVDLWTNGNPSRVSFAKAENAIAFVLLEEIEQIAKMGQP